MRAATLTASMATLAIALSAGCIRHGLTTDGSSVSFGPSRGGGIRAPAALPGQGEGYWMPPRWRSRGLRYGTDELVSTIVHTGRVLARQSPGAVLSVADLSLERGGRSAWHRSHQTGRDVDLIFFVKEETGERVRASSMRVFAADGLSRPSAVPAALEEPRYRFDVERNWLLVRALITNPMSEIQYIFISDDLKQMLIEHARASGESEALIQKAGYLLHQPSDSLPHDDHMHVRIFCSRADLAYGCRDRGVLRWHKKDYKYDRSGARRGLAKLAAANLAGRLYAMLSLSALPFRGFVHR